MYNKKLILRQSFLVLLAFILLSDFGCAFIKSGAPPKKHGYGEIDKYGCQEPPPDLFTSSDLDLDFAQSTFGKIVTGEIKVQTQPEVLSLASKAVQEARIRDYLRCLAIKRDGYNLEQAAYLDRFNAFMAINPSATEFIEWQKNNPFPKSSSSDSIKEQLDLLRKQLIPRSLSSDQREKFVNILKTNPGVINLSSLFGDQESVRFANELGIAIKSAGWRIQKRTIGLLRHPQPPPGIIAGVNNLKNLPDHAQTLIKAFSAVGFKIEMQEDTNLPVSIIELIISSKPQL